MNIAVVDDSAADRLQIDTLVSDYLQTHQLHADIFQFASGEDFLKEFLPGNYTILLLDLYMQGISGMDVAYQVRQQGDDCQLVFITSSDACAVQSYEVKASNYLLKPISPASIELMMDRCVEELNLKRETITVISNRNPVQIKLHNILHVNSQQNHLNIHTDGGILKTYMTFEQLEELLANDKQFLMCYKGCMINMDRVIEVEDEAFLLENGDRALIRKRGRNQIKQAYFDYLCNQTEAMS